MPGSESTPQRPTERAPTLEAAVPKARRAPTFSILEVVIVAVILAVLAIVVVPQFSSAADVARQNSLRDELRYLRTQVMIFAAQHAGVPPGFPNGDTQAQPDYDTLVKQLTQYTNERGQFSAIPGNGFNLGPYLKAMPANAINGSTRVRLVAKDQPFPKTPQGPEGWLYQPATGLVAANSAGTDSAGVPYFDY